MIAASRPVNNNVSTGAVQSRIYTALALL